MDLTSRNGTNGSGKSTLLSAMYYRAEEQYLGGKPELSDSEVMSNTYFRRQVGEFVHLDPGSKFDVAVYYDGAESNPFMKQAERRQAALGRDYELQMFKKMAARGRKESSRESKDAVFDELKQLLDRLHVSSGSALLFIDEFENGLDPRRHLRVREILESIIGPDDIAIIATNSPILFKEELPRLDFTFPETGMHGPEKTEGVSAEEIEQRLGYYRYTKEIENFVRSIGDLFYRRPDEWSEESRNALKELLESESYQKAIKDRGVNSRIALIEGSPQALQSLDEGSIDLFEILLERSDPFRRNTTDRYASIGNIYAEIRDGDRSFGIRLKSTDEIEAGFQEAASRAQ